MPSLRHRVEVPDEVVSMFAWERADHKAEQRRKDAAAAAEDAATIRQLDLWETTHLASASPATPS